MLLIARTTALTHGTGNAALLFRNSIFLALAAALLIITPTPPGEAGWWSKLAREAGDASSGVGRTGIGALDEAARLVGKLPKSTKGVALAAHATPEGHWKFVNRDGEVFTAASPDEMARVVPNLAPDAVATGRPPELSLYLSKATVFNHPDRLTELPSDAHLRVTAGKNSYRVREVVRDAKTVLQADIRPNVVLPLTNRVEFDEALWQLERRLNRADIRVLSLKSGAPQTLPSAPRFDKKSGTALVDAVDPDHLASSLDGVRGQTVLVSGRVEADRLVFSPQSGGERSLKLSDLRASAANNDVNLIILQAPTPRQPGGRNWLWQTVEVDGLADAVKRATYADFLNALAASRGQMSVSTTLQGRGRVLIEAIPSGTSAVPLSDVVTDWLTEAVSSVTGNVVTSVITADVNSQERQSELDLRIIPGIHSNFQFGYLGALFLGVLGLGIARGWWAHVWKPETREDYPGLAGYTAARVVKALVFVFLFLPLVGPFAFIVGVLTKAVAVILAPFRFLGWLFGRKRGAADTNA